MKLKKVDHSNEVLKLWIWFL